MRSFTFFVLALLTTTLAACANDPGRHTVSSTEGSTLVQTGEVTAVNETHLTIRLQNGELRVYAVGTGEVFRIGDRVRLISHKGETRITH